MINTDENHTDFNLERNFPKINGLIGFLVLDKTGLLYFSKVARDQLILANNIFQIAGFISVLMIYSQDLIGSEEAGIKLEDINLGSTHFYVCTRENVIFAYFVEKHKVSKDFQNYVQIIIRKFIEKYYDSYIKDFKGDLSPFHKFDEVLNHYFKI